MGVSPQEQVQPGQDGSQTKGAPARLAAADVLDRILTDRATMEQALGASTRFAALEGADKAFARALVGAALRRLGTLDALIARHVERPLPDTARWPRALLRIACAQMVALDGPAHASVHAAVAAVKLAPGGVRYAGLLNAVLRKVARDVAQGETPDEPGQDLPPWMWNRWRIVLGAERAADLVKSLQVEAARDLSVRDGDPQDWAQRLGGEVVGLGSVRLPQDAPKVTALPGYEEGAWWVQDAGAAAAVALMGDVRGLRVADLCAAPGGKTMQLAAGGADVVAIDASTKRLERVEANLKRVRLQARIEPGDAQQVARMGLFDAILLDAPCSATGTIRRRPDAAWLHGPADPSRHSDVQVRLIEAAAGALKPGGQLMYVVCSLEPEEGEGMLEPARQAGLRLKPFTPQELGPFAPALRANGAALLLPDILPDGGNDGFFIARFIKP